MLNTLSINVNCGSIYNRNLEKLRDLPWVPGSLPISETRKRAVDAFWGMGTFSLPGGSTWPCLREIKLWYSTWLELSNVVDMSIALTNFVLVKFFSMSRLLVHSVYPRGFSFLVFERAEAGVKQGEGCKKDLPKRHFLRGGASLLILAFCLSSLSSLDWTHKHRCVNALQAILFRISLICRELGEAEGTSQARRLCRG